MMNDNYISVLMIQAQLNVEVTPVHELCLFDDNWHNQFKHSKELIENYHPDIILYPETFYNPDCESDFIDMSLNSLVVAGSTYTGHQNETIVFSKGKRHNIFKNNPSPLEVASKYMEYQSFNNLVETGLWRQNQHTFQVKNKDVIVLNCMEYYNSAYFIARSNKYNQNLFGILCPCSSSNIELFEQESIALTNHKENIYTFLCNRISAREDSTTKGNSYIYGAISRTQKVLIKQQYPNETNLSHACGIAKLSNKPSWIYGKFAITDNLSPFGRSDNFLSTPRSLMIDSLNC